MLINIFTDDIRFPTKSDKNNGFTVLYLVKMFISIKKWLFCLLGDYFDSEQDDTHSDYIIHIKKCTYLP